MEDELTGYLHNISPLKKGSKTTWFDMQIQTEAEVVRGVCFSAAKHNDFKKYSEHTIHYLWTLHSLAGFKRAVRGLDLEMLMGDGGCVDCLVCSA